MTLRFDTLLFSRAFTAISTSGKKARVNAWFIRMFLTKSFVDNFKSEAFCLLRVLARLVIHLGARMIAIVLRRDAEQLEQESPRLWWLVLSGKHLPGSLMMIMVKLERLAKLILTDSGEVS